MESERTRCHEFLANQFRLLLHGAACVLMSVLQEAAQGTPWAKAQAGTLRLRVPVRKSNPPQANIPTRHGIICPKYSLQEPVSRRRATYQF